MKQKPVIAITMGDPAGVGPEIIAKLFAGGHLLPVCRPVVIGDAGVMKKIIEELGLPIKVRKIASTAEVRTAEAGLDILTFNLVTISTHRWGEPNPSSGTAAVTYVKKAVELALRGEAEAIVTAPINKAMINAAGCHYAGHTELLADLTHAKEYGMMFVGGGLRIILATIHIPLRDVPNRIKAGMLLKTLRLADAAARSFGIETPRIGVAALNPHAGEGGLFGNEEADEILPAVIQARMEGIDASDPVPADTLFHKARKNMYDILVAMYHDQGLAPLKMLAFGDTVNVTVGLPIIRTSVDHGTAYDIAGKGIADPSSLLEAVKLAARMSSFRASSWRERET